MRKWSKSLIFSLFIISMLFPIIPFGVKAQNTIPIFTVGACGPAPIGNWDGIPFAATTGDYFRYNALEGLFELPYGAETGDYDNLVPLLATSWTIHSRPDEMNTQGFMNFLQLEMRKRQTFLPIIELKHGGKKKEERIKNVLEP